MNIFNDYRIVQNQALANEFTKRSLVALKIKLDVSSKQIYTELPLQFTDNCFIVVILNRLNSFIIVKDYSVMDYELLPGMKHYPPRLLVTVSAIVTVKNKFTLVMQLLNAVAIQKDYDLKYTISNHIKVVKGYVGRDVDSDEYKEEILAVLHDKDDPKKITLRLSLIHI